QGPRYTSPARQLTLARLAESLHGVGYIRLRCRVGSCELFDDLCARLQVGVVLSELAWPGTPFEAVTVLLPAKQGLTHRPAAFDTLELEDFSKPAPVASSHRSEALDVKDE